MAGRQQPFDHLLKLIIIGDSAVGKTCLLLKFSDENFQNSHITTIGIDFKIKTINLDGKNVKVQIWDTAGQERFRTITQTYYRGAQGVILAYDCTQQHTFDNISNWLNQVEQHAQPNVKKILIGNKCDLEDQKVISKEMGQEIAKRHNMTFYETSAKTGYNINAAFEGISRDIIKNIEQTKKDSPDGEISQGSSGAGGKGKPGMRNHSNSQQLNKGSNPAKKKGKCC